MMATLLTFLSMMIPVFNLNITFGTTGSDVTKNTENGYH